MGRLKAVVDPATDTAIYNYDAVGNLLSISRQSSASLSVIEFSPDKGPVSTAVTIWGTGFSTTPSNNTVKFNGTVATVTSATATEIKTTVPSGATTGPISVTVGTSTATSAAAFTVTSSAGAPTITSFTPTIGTPGTAVTIDGTNFETTPASNDVKFNTSHALVSSATAATIATNVPFATGSGRISVVTSSGKAVSSADFFVPPSPYTAADVQFTARMSVGGSSQTVTISTANKIALIVFDGTAGQQVSLGMSGVTIGGITCCGSDVTIYDPRNAVVATIALTTSGGAIDTRLPMNGTYTILVDPRSTFTGNMTLTLSEDLTGILTTTGPSFTANLRPGQRARLTFTGTANQRVDLGITSVTIGGSTCCSADVFILKPDGTTLASTQVAVAGSFGPDIDTQLPVSGTYTVLVDPVGSKSGNITLTLSEPITGTVTTTGPSFAASIARPGQDVRLTFDGTANQRVSLGTTGITIGSSTCCSADVFILKPDGTTLASTQVAVAGSFGPDIDTQLPVSGTYTVLVDPVNSKSGNITLTLSEPITGTITTTGSSFTASIARSGQDVRLTFDGTANQRVSLGITNITIGGSTCCSANVFILKPDGTTLSSTQVAVAGSFGPDIDTQLPVSGTYTVLVDPVNSKSGNITLTLSEPITGTVIINGSSVPVSISRAGQDARITFNGTANQQVTVRVTNNTINSVTVSLLKPDFVSLTSTNSGASSFNLATVTLPTTGTYTVLIDPASSKTGSMNVSVTSP